MVLEGLCEYRAIFALGRVEEFVQAALTFSCPVKPTAFRFEQVSLLLGAAEDRLLACNAEKSLELDVKLDFIDEENSDVGSDEVDVEAAELLAQVREQRKRFEVFRKMEGLPYMWSYIRDADEETLGRILVSNERIEALAAFGIVPHHVLDSIPLHDHAETWRPFADTFRETTEPHRWFLNRCRDLMALGLFVQAAEWAAFGQEVCDTVNFERGKSSPSTLGKVYFAGDKEQSVVVHKVLAKLIWEYTTYCLQLWDGAFSIGDPPPYSFDDFCDLSQAARLHCVLTNSTKDSIVDDVKAWLRHSIDAPAEKLELFTFGLPDDAVGVMDEIMIDVLRQKVVECERSAAAAMFSTVASIAIASKPTLAASDRVVRSPLHLMRFILHIVYDADCAAMDILDDVEDMYTCIPDPEAHKAVGATDEEWNELMTKANALNDHLVTVADVLKPYGFSQALSFQELESQCTATTCRNLFQNMFRTLGANWMSADEWHAAIDRISYIHQRTFHLMPKDELFELYIRALVHQDHFDVLDRVLDMWQTIESLRILVAHVKELANSSPALSHPLLDKARRLLMLAGQKKQLPEIDGELKFLQACELLNRLEECKKPGGGGLKTAKNFIRNVDPLSLVADGVGGATHTVVEGIVGSASKIRTGGVVGGLRSIAGGVFAADGAIAHLKDGIADRVKNVVHTLVLDTALGPPPFSNPLQLRLKWQASEAVQANMVEQLLQYNINVLDHQKLLQDFLALLPPCAKPSKDISCLLCSAFLLQGRLQDAMIFIDELLAAGHPKAWRFCVSYAWRDDADRDAANGLLAQALKSCDATALPEVLACLPQEKDDEIPADILEGSVRKYRFDPGGGYPSSLHRLIERDEVVAHALVGRLQQGGACSSRASGLTVGSALLVEDPFANDPSAGDPRSDDPFAGDPFADDPFADDPFAGDAFASDRSSPNNSRFAAPGKSAAMPVGGKTRTAVMPVEERIESPASKQSSANWSFSSDFSVNEEPMKVDTVSPVQTEPIQMREDPAVPVHVSDRGMSFSSNEPSPSMRSRPSFLEATPLQIMDMSKSDAGLFVERHLPEWIGTRRKLSRELVQVLDATSDSHKALLAREVLCHLAGKGDRVDILGVGDWTATRALRQCLAESPSLDVTGTVIDRDKFFNSCERRSLPAVCCALSGAQLGGLTASFIAKRGLLRNPRDSGLRSWLTLDDMRALLDEAEGPKYFTFARWWRDTPELADIIQRKREAVVAQETYEHLYRAKPINRTVSQLLLEAPDERFGQAVSSAAPSLAGLTSSLQTPRTSIQSTPRGITDQVAKLAERVVAGEVEEACSAAALLMQMPACQRALAPAGNITILAHVLRRFPSSRSTEALNVLAPSLQRFR
eukprot:GEMP01001373.1.p1 GENE.GEMP01001373.1~~GEMP01001373.1.p1  ORF type:complete len:1374 (-),score=331.22 GEMP01001373.1:1316-5437(-)